MKYLIILFTLTVSVSCVSQSRHVLPDYLQKNIQARIDRGDSPSYAIGIIDASGTRYFFFGSKTAEGGSIDEHTIYEIGSISKTFTGILLAQMVLDGKLKLEDAAQLYLPEQVTLPKWNDQQITLGNLSDHTSSLPRMPANFAPADPSNPYADYSVEQMYDFLSGHELRREVGSEYEYSNLAQGLLGHILGLKAGMSYEELMLKTIAKPLGIKETKITFDKRMSKNLAPGHSNGQIVSNWDIPTFAGAGAIRSSVHDMLIYLAANLGLKKSPLYPAMQLSHKARHDMAGNNRVGLGWHIQSGAEGDVIWHNGGTGGYRTFAGFVQETGKGVVVLTNSNLGADDIGFHLLNPDFNLVE